MPCKTRRADKCESCAALYQGDAYKLIAEGLRGGEYVTDEVKDHPALFVTFTAPGFGPVHTQRTDKQGNALACRPRRGGERCPHGNELSCNQRHQDDDHRLGQAIASCCFDYEGAATWNHFAGKLWRQTRNAIDRELAKRLGLSLKAMRETTCKTNYVKIAEFQARGLVHFHVAIRIDGPKGAKSTVETNDLIEAIRAAHETTDVETIDDKRIGWGEQLDIRIIDNDEERNKLAGYFAEYATKGADAKGLLTSRIRDERQIDRLPVNDHQARLIRAAWKLANEHDELNTNRWAHQFGFGGHFLTKSTAWSTTFKALRQKRSDHHAELQRQSWQALSPQAQLVIEKRFDYAGCGFATPTQAHLDALRQQPPTTADVAA